MNGFYSKSVFILRLKSEYLLLVSNDTHLHELLRQRASLVRQQQVAKTQVLKAITMHRANLCCDLLAVYLHLCILLQPS